jgi:hypothetical protein
VHFTELIEVNIGSLNDLDFADLNVLNGVDGGDLFGDLLFDNLTGEKVKNLGSVGFCNLLGNNIIDAFTDNLLLG